MFNRPVRYQQTNWAMRKSPAKLPKRWQKSTVLISLCQKSPIGCGLPCNDGWPISKRSCPITHRRMTATWRSAMPYRKSIFAKSCSGWKQRLNHWTIRLCFVTTICRRAIFYSKNRAAVAHRRAVPLNSWGNHSFLSFTFPIFRSIFHNTAHFQLLKHNKKNVCKNDLKVCYGSLLSMPSPPPGPRLPILGSIKMI